MIKVIKNIVSPTRYLIKCPYKMKPTRIVVHNTANDASARNEVSYMISNNRQTSFHYAVDDKEAVQGLPLDRNGWHASDGNGKGNREGIAIEICYSKSGGEKFIKAEQNAVELIVDILKRYGWGVDRVTKHQDYANKYCPHRTLDMGWDRFIKMIETRLESAENGKISDTNASSLEITYQTWDDVKNKWLPNVVNDTDYAGIFGHDVCCVYANANIGDIYYRVHCKGGKWLPEVKNRSDYAGLYNKPIDGFMIKSSEQKIKYRVHLRRSNSWLPWVDGYSTNDSNNGYAGVLGQEIDAIQIK